jgi:hypothetical protein
MHIDEGLKIQHASAYDGVPPAAEADDLRQLQLENKWDGVTNELERCNAMSPEQIRSTRNAAVILLEQQQHVWDGVTNELERCNAMSPQQARSAKQAADAMQH